jgi:DNA polymerase-3 subunit chi
VQVDFYRLGDTPLARVLSQVAARVLAGGGRLLVVAGDRAADLDEALWGGEDSFLPHGRATEGDTGADQPVLIATDCTASNGARNVALADGVWREAALGFDRAFHFFDGDGIEAARAAWRGLAGREDVVRNFWSQDETGRWVKTA